MGRLRVQHCVVNMTTRQYGPNPTSDLLGIDYFHTVPADTEFPRTLAKLELFVRFFGTDGVSGRVRVTVSYLWPDGTDRELVYRRLFDVAVHDVTGPVVLDRGFKLINVLVPGEGTYAMRVTRRVRRPWEANSGWRVLAADYIQIARAA
ncbi:hypothetical protein R5W24_004725 [Gemmata sp. JC717]|uniref:hypothetical protein n=1 Tax=Gemmata algarum TaxID=2975278 RepID=UPI0021BA72BB|nr:hypothetical protein [Gemmata algarum]MDY3555582.1 hypothetical protein [Gemmata algarum]